MTSDEHLKIVRRAYARQVSAALQVKDPRVEDAFAGVRREDFLGPGPWPIFRFGSRYVPTRARIRFYLYTDDSSHFARAPHSTTANHRCTPPSHCAAPREAPKHVVHIGAALVLYRIMAHLDRRHPVERDRHRVLNLTSRRLPWTTFLRIPNVAVIRGDGSTALLRPGRRDLCERGATRPATPGSTVSAMWPADPPAHDRQRVQSIDFANMHPTRSVFRIERQGAEFLAQWISPWRSIPAPHAGRDIRAVTGSRVSRRMIGNESPASIERLTFRLSDAGCARRTGVGYE